MKIIKKTLKNGLRVLMIPMKDNPTVTVLSLVETGSKYENKENNGISHFLEHMCFKGTERRPKATDISLELDAIGSQYNAFTGQEYTGYYAKADAKHFKKIFDVITDIYLNSTFPETEIEKEKGVIIEEINMYEDMPHRHVQDMIMELLYGDTPAGWNIAGSKENILKMKREDFVNYKKLHYIPNATTLVIAGNIEPVLVMKEVNKTFGKVSKSKKGNKIKTIENQTKPEVLLKFKETDQTHFVLAFRSFDFKNKKNRILSILSGILGAGMSSRLFVKLREEMGVGYYVSAYNDTYTDHGYFAIRAGVDNKRVHEVLEAILKECKKLCEELVDEKELNKVKECLIGNMKLSLESSDDIANYFGMQELLKKEIKQVSEKEKELRKVTSKEVRDMARVIFKEAHMNLALIGPYKDKDNFIDILKF